MDRIDDIIAVPLPGARERQALAMQALRPFEQHKVLPISMWPRRRSVPILACDINAVEAARYLSAKSEGTSNYSIRALLRAYHCTGWSSREVVQAVRAAQAYVYGSTSCALTNEAWNSIVDQKALDYGYKIEASTVSEQKPSAKLQIE
jgi:hypothetical protein